MKKLLFALALLITSISFSQELVKSVPLKVAKKSDVFQVVDENNKQLILFFNNKIESKAIRFDNLFQVIDSISINRPSNEYDDIVGYGKSGSKYYSYWMSSNKEKMLSQCFDFNNKNVAIKTYNLNFDKEKIIQLTTVKDIFYIITVSKYSNILNFYIFKEDQLSKKSTDLSSQKFALYDGSLATLWELFGEYSEIDSPFFVQKIAKESPASLTFAANKKKAYIVENSLFFTFDNNNTYTQTFTINLSDFSFSQKTYVKPYLETPFFEDGKPILHFTSNSFFIENKLLQMKSDWKKMILTVKDLEDNELKSFVINTDVEIDFKNSEINQENQSVKNTRILDKSNQLLRKISNLNASVSCYSNNQTILLTLGGVSILQNNNGVMIGSMIGGLSGALIGAAISSNYSLYNINSYSGRKVVYINCLFDKNFNHLSGEIKKTAFDKLRIFVEEKKDLKNQIVFRFNNNGLFFGGYDQSANLYSFYEFLD